MRSRVQLRGLKKARSTVAARADGQVSRTTPASASRKCLRTLPAVDNQGENRRTPRALTTTRDDGSPIVPRRFESRALSSARSVRSCSLLHAPYEGASDRPWSVLTSASDGRGQGGLELSDSREFCRPPIRGSTPGSRLGRDWVLPRPIRPTMKRRRQGYVANPGGRVGAAARRRGCTGRVRFYEPCSHPRVLEECLLCPLGGLSRGGPGPAM